MLAAHVFLFLFFLGGGRGGEGGGGGFMPGQLEGTSICKGTLLIDHQEFTTIGGPSNNWTCAVTSTDKFVSRKRFRYLWSSSDQCPRQM